MNDRDQDLDALLQPLTERKTSSEQLQRWSAAVEHAATQPAINKVPRRSSPWLLLAAMLVGFALGALAMRMQLVSQDDQIGSVAENFGDDAATIVRITAKSY